MSFALTRNDTLRQAVGCDTTISRESLLQHLFALAFRQMVYAQIWEDPDVDLAALNVQPDDHIVTIASGGCNALSYLVADPRAITALDLNHTHVALGRLKVAGLRHLPGWETFFAFFGAADRPFNHDIYRRYLADKLDADSRSYWETRTLGGIGRAPIEMFGRNIYRHGLLGRFIGLGHKLAWLYGIRPKDFLALETLEQQQTYFNTVISPLFDKPLIRWAASNKMSLYGLGIPPAQYDALAGGQHMADVLRERLRKLTCDFPLADNYFAWQAFGRRYSEAENATLPPYLQQKNFSDLRERADRVAFVNASFTDHLATLPPASRDCYVLLDAQDWMSDDQLNALWREIIRTARPGARVIFRTAATATLLPGRLDERLLSRWTYETERSAELTRQDRSAIYGAFHLYRLAA
jgi:S-adenosylmethionine-diacylglycerol 3-amino-3-carboxypropyl transferase